MLSGEARLLPFTDFQCTREKPGFWPDKMTFVVSLIDLSGRQLATAGGKARGLAQLAQAGFPVPDGFVILPNAFDGEKLTAVAWAQVQARLNAWRHHQPDITFAVRSSGHDEDSAQAAFAGQFTTLLNLATDEAVQAAIHTVYASRQNDQATVYRQDRQLNENQAMTVLVQPLIVADCAGVCFSVDPVRQLRELIVVNAAWSLGAGVMDGTITADTAWVYRHDFSLEKQHIVPKPLQLFPEVSGGIGSAAVPTAQQRATCLPPTWLGRVAQFGLAAELLFGTPQEIEWAICGQQLWILQSRPITALPPELAVTPPFPVDWAGEAERRAWWTLSDYSRGSTPPLPLEHDYYMAVRESIREETCRFLGVERNQTTRIWHGRAYETAKPSGLTAADRRVRQAARQDLQQRLQSQGLTSWDHWGPEVVTALERLRAFDLAAAAASGPALADHLEEVLAVLRRNSFLHPGLSFKPGPAYFQAFAALTGLSGEAAETAAYRLLDSEENMLTRLVDGLYEIARLARQNTAVGAPVAEPPPDVMARLTALPQAGLFLAQLARFLAEFGERIGDGYGSEMTVLTPTWREEPARLLRLAAVYLDPARAAPALLRARARAAREAQVEALCAAQPEATAVAEFRRQWAYARRSLTVLEDHNHWLEQVSGGLLRQAIMAAAHRLAHAGTLAAPEDIFWLTFAEILATLRAETADSLAETVVARRIQQAQWAEMTPPPILGVPPTHLPSRPPLVDEVVDEEAEQENGRLRGVGASPGQVTGRAWVVTDGSAMPALAPGDVLVAANAGPLWTPLFPILGGLVLESGSLGQHAAVTAREYGVPAVIGCRRATQHIPDGAIVQVDGQAGVVAMERSSSRSSTS
jgi:rifampicin phosphotransferase